MTLQTTLRPAARPNLLRKPLFLAAASLMACAVALPASAASWWETSPVSIGSTQVNVRNKGALGDGVHDDTAAIQAAINSLPTSGGTVVIPAGKYMINALKSINLRSHVRLQLDPSAQLVAIPNSSERYYIVRAYKVNNVEIVGGQIIGDRANHKGSTGEWGYGINITASKNVNVRNVRVSNAWGDGLLIGASGSGSTVVPSTDVTIDNVVSTNNRRQGLSILPSQRVYIVNSTFSNTNGTKPEAGIDVEPQKQGTVKDLRIEKSVFSGNRGNGIEVRHNVSNLVITGNTIKSNNGFGIYTDSPSYGRISSNTITLNGLDGVGLLKTTHDFSLTNNTMTYNSTRYYTQRGLSVYTLGSSSRDLQVDSTTYRISISGNTLTPKR